LSGWTRKGPVTAGRVRATVDSARTAGERQIAGSRVNDVTVTARKSENNQRFIT